MRHELAEALGKDEDAVESYICHTVGRKLQTTGDPYQAIIQQAKSWWHSSSSEPPPFTAVLFCLSHAAAHMAAEGQYAANNYYVRLAQLTGIERGRLSFHGKSTEILWSYLNSWLIKNNFDFGRPTAQAINSWKYVGKALSQVVVRAGDRELFHDMFERYGFSGTEEISTEEIRYYLEHWMRTSYANARLKAAWRRKELQGRVCEAAIAELSAWGQNENSTGSMPTDGSRKVKLCLAAQFIPRFPNEVLDIQLGRPGELNEPLGPLKVEGNSQYFNLSNDHYGTFSTINPRPLGTDGRMLTHGFIFSGNRGELLEWHPRLVIPFAESTRGHYWIEVSRVVLGRPHLILVRDIKSMTKKVEQYLNEAALEMPSVATSDELQGVPTGWVLYKGAVFGEAQYSPSKDLACLAPLGGEGTMIVNGHLRLSYGIFHSSSRVDISLIASEGPTEIEAFSLEGATRDALISMASNNGGNCELTLPANSNEPGSVIGFKGYRNGKLVASQEILFRDSSTPRPLNRYSDELVFYNTILSATNSEITKNIVIIIGTIVHGELPLHQPPTTLEEGHHLPEGYSETGQAAELQGSIDLYSDRETCVSRGYHYWICEPPKPGLPKKAPLKQECKDCNQSLIVVDRGKRSAQSKAAAREAPRYRPKAQQELQPIDHDLLLDALCFLGCGSWGAFEALLPEGGYTPWRARSLAQDLFLLGFLDLELRHGTNYVRRWSVPPLAINFIDQERAFLSGFRNAQLTEVIRGAVKEIGGTLNKTRMAGRPSMVVLEGVRFEEATKVLSDIQDPLGRNLSIVDYPGYSIATACLALGGLSECLSPVSIGHANSLEAFNPKSGRWNTVKDAQSSGAYRWNDGVQNYAYLSPDGKMWRGPYQVVKLLAAKRENIRLHAYDRSSYKVKATLGCDVPGLLGRALVACSGTLPEARNGVLMYENVAPLVAGQVMEILYGKAGDTHVASKSN